MYLFSYELQNIVHEKHSEGKEEMTAHTYRNKISVCPRVGEGMKNVKCRNQRLFSVGPDWYFKTREGIEIGPYENEKDAENGINRFIRQIAFNMIRAEAPLA